MMAASLIACGGHESIHIYDKTTATGTAGSNAESSTVVVEGDTGSSSGTETTNGSASSSSTGDDAIDSTLGTGFATGCAVAIWRGGAVIYAEGFGTKNAAGDPVTPSAP